MFELINNWIEDIRARQTGTRDNLIFKLDALGWKHYDIGIKIGLSRQQVDNIVNGANLGIFTQISLDYKNGKKPSELAEYYGFDIPMVWHTLFFQLETFSS